MSKDPELLIGLRDGELEALAESLLAPAAQVRLDELLAQNAGNQLSAREQAELDRLLERVDQLTILKTRAQYTLEKEFSITSVSPVPRAIVSRRHGARR
jgi:hypothetical protein